MDPFLVGAKNEYQIRSMELHKRILTECGQLFIDSQDRHAAREAMVQVEIALKEKSGVKKEIRRRFNSKTVWRRKRHKIARTIWRLDIIW
jgi:hypothetical protein